MRSRFAAFVQHVRVNEMFHPRALVSGVIEHVQTGVLGLLHDTDRLAQSERGSAAVNWAIHAIHISKLDP